MNKKIIVITILSLALMIPIIGKKMIDTQRFSVPFNALTQQNIPDYFPKSVHDINALVDITINRTKKNIDKLIAIPAHERTFANTAMAFDHATAYDFSVVQSMLSVLFYLSPDDAIRSAAQAAMLRMSEFAIENLANNVAVYQSFKDYMNNNAKTENLTAKQRYYLKELMNDFKRNGLDLPDEKRKQVKEIQKELSKLSIEFDQNINTEKRTITVSKNDLVGLDEDFINSLKRDGDNYILGTDYPTYFMVMEHCQVPETRKKMYYLFSNRAYPANLKVLQDIIAKRDALAQLLGFNSFSQLNLDAEMAKNPERVEQFLKELFDKAAPKEDSEFVRFSTDLPQDVELSASGKLYPWDKSYVSTQYKKKHYQLDDRVVSEYFPMENTVKGLMNIYERFFNIKMIEMPMKQLWHDNVSLLEIRNAATNELLGLLLLDLFPRANKYNHACEITIIPTIFENGLRKPALAVVIANFPQSTPTKPSLLKLDDVRTFFHEFGHAIHTILGATDMASTSGTNVKTDFVEMPSQMLEEWLWDPVIIKQLSSHYQTKAPLPDNLIKTIIELKNFNSGAWIDRQIFYALLSLHLFDKGAKKDIVAIQQQLYKNTRKHDEFDPENHDFASFGHLMGYGARYYSYLWSKVFALDLFYYIKPYGLLNPEIGNKYAQIILGNGGSKDPNELLNEFLGRAPSIDAFIKDMGLQ